MDLFERSAMRRKVGEPLAERMRPTDLEEFAGQRHLLKAGKLLSNIDSASSIPSLILWGPPGTGKTTLARLLANRTNQSYVALSAVSAGVKEVRTVAESAKRNRDQFSRRTILFLDEIHRFSKAQQDVLLPFVEAGVVTLVGATTENPSFSINAALLSRMRVVRFEALPPEDLSSLIDRALADAERGLGKDELSIDGDAKSALITAAHGDARRMLGGLEAAGELAVREGQKNIAVAMVQEALQQRTLLYDKAGDEHYGVVSAFIKSMRGSDPDAASYWMVRMLEAGEDPLFVLRRMVIFASEDIGNADPNALSVATSALQAFRFIGMPEGSLPMTQAAVYLACAPKSNTALSTYAAARASVQEHGALPVPAKLINANTKLDREIGRGKGYKYPHNFSGHYIAEDYLPEQLSGQRFYQPSDSGEERAMAARLAKWRGQDGDEVNSEGGDSDG